MKQAIQEERKFTACLYLRLSKEDKDKIESNSISSQREQIQGYLMDKTDIMVYSELVDDGYSGSSFDRPQLQEMLELAQNGTINCVIFRDLSRFGRNFIDVGRYLDHLFPQWGVRVISLTEQYDSLNKRTNADNIMLPFFNLINDAYCRDISIKVRSNLDTQRKKGQFIASFPVYGYLRSPEDKHKLIPDPFASSVIVDIFNWKMEGMSNQGVAKHLNELGILSPMEYKKHMGVSFSTSFQKNEKALWSAVAVGRILKNEVYIGTLVQGKRTTPNHKVKKEVIKPEEEWVKIPNTHEPLVSVDVFRIVNGLLGTDSRVAPNKKEVYPFSGLLFCADCKEQLVRNSCSKSNGKSYPFYMCGTNRTKKECTSHRIYDHELEQGFITALQQHIKNLVNLQEILSFIDLLPLKSAQSGKYNLEMKQFEEEVTRCEKLKTVLFEQYSNGVIEKTEYTRLFQLYEQKESTSRKSILRVQEELDNLQSNSSNETKWIEDFKKFQNVTTINRKMIVTLVDKITVYEDKRIEIAFKYHSNYLVALSFVESIATEHTLPNNLELEVS